MMWWFILALVVVILVLAAWVDRKRRGTPLRGNHSGQGEPESKYFNRYGSSGGGPGVGGGDGGVGGGF